MKVHILWAASRCVERETDGQKPTARDWGDDSICVKCYLASTKT